MAYDVKKIEDKWQKKWVRESTFRAIDFHPTKPKYYVLYEFFNISGNLHMGHLKGTIPADALARYKRFCGYNVLFPIGGDSFGLPAENAAIKSGTKPHDFIEEGMEKVIKQSQMLGLSFDWDRTISTSDPEYYKWTQWIFLQLYNQGKAYKKEGFVNFCPNCQTVLSNEDCQDGRCDRCGGEVVQRERSVWFLKMKDYSEKLLSNVDRINMSENLKEAQRNWIGKSEGMQVSFDIVNHSGNKIGMLPIFTTCIETIYGVTFLVVAPEHKLVKDLHDSINNIENVVKYIEQTSLRSEFERLTDQKKKSGCILEGVFGINPLTNQEVPIYLADFVLANYGTGAVMAVPAHDQRDFEFANLFNIPLVQVIEGNCKEQAVEKVEYLNDNRKLINSAEFSGVSVVDAKLLISNKIIDLGKGEKKINYKMQDWPFNRQRYWGEPFPIVFCDKCGTVTLPINQLPLTLPDTNDYLPNENGDSPLSKVADWVNCTCPKCGGQAHRETDTMPNWAGSSWYWLRYADPHNSEALADYDKLKYWGSVDCYTGGTEHITRHVLYAFFWQNFLYEIGVVPSRDPFIRKMGSGLILDDQGKKMSKSSSNGVSPLDVIDKYGADVARLHIHFLGGYEDNIPWTYNGISGIAAFLDKVWALQDIIKGNDVSTEHIYVLNRLIKKVSDDIENLRLNTAIAAFMIFIKKIKEDSFITRDELRQFLILLNPLAPHITSEMYERVFNVEITDETWPKYHEEFLLEEFIDLPIQINGKFAKIIKIMKDFDCQKVLAEIKRQFPELLSDSVILKNVIFIKNKIINLIK